ncbi:MAG TPA: type II toxin-antitoxin system VapC family toxin [Bryobacteraceae bacterium]|nr:type II toxin-antitoxin system VapC family toxin [Bryobacteraceae bacterium]
MIVDTSVAMAILRGEREGRSFAEIMELEEGARGQAPGAGRRAARQATLKMSVASYVEAGVAMDAARNPVVSRQLDELIRIAGIELRPVTVEQARLAREAYRDFGRGSGHAAKLNLGDCYAYALAKELGEPLLFQGAGLAETDVEAAV